ncbi:hypothetical protein QZH41_005590 [Actinostola sp. cb2023]|nr:hypothetical protein QZH41_005590 [Actinostola sp. cb2023]
MGGSKYVPSNARLHKSGEAWAAGPSRGPQWLLIDLRTVKEVTAIATQGHPDVQWIKTYQILSGNDPNSLTLYGNGKIFTGNTDSNSVVKNLLDPPIEARQTQRTTKKKRKTESKDKKQVLKYPDTPAPFIKREICLSQVENSMKKNFVR